MVSIPELLSRVTNDHNEIVWPGIDHLFHDLKGYAYNLAPKRAPGTWAGSFRLETLDGRKLVMKDGELCLVWSLDGQAEIKFTMLDANPENREAVPKIGMVSQLVQRTSHLTCPSVLRRDTGIPLDKRCSRERAKYGKRYTRNMGRQQRQGSKRGVP